MTYLSLSKHLQHLVVRYATHTVIAGAVVWLLGALAIVTASLSAVEKSGLRIRADELTIIETSSPTEAPEQILQQIQNTPDRKVLHAKSQPAGSFWIVVNTEISPDIGEHTLELRMLRSEDARFWKVSNLKQRNLIPIESRSIKGGIALNFTQDGPERSLIILGKVTPKGLTRPKAVLWKPGQFTASVSQFDISGGVFLGGFFALALLSFLIALTAKDWSFLLFTGWLVTSLRIALINNGWDFFWIGSPLSPEWVNFTLKVTLAAHPLLTLLLFKSLFSSEIRHTRLSNYLKSLTKPYIFILLASTVIDYQSLLPFVWVSSAIGMLAVAIALGFIIVRNRSNASLWYGASWVLTFSGYIIEAGFASGLISNTLAMLNSQTASMASAFITAIALSEKLKNERSHRVAAQRERITALEALSETYNRMPIGLFKCRTSDGLIVLCNPEFVRTFGLEVSSQDFSEKSIFLQNLVGPTVEHQLRIAAETSVELEFFSSKPNTKQGRWFLARVTTKAEIIEGSIEDITSRKEAEDQLRHLVDHDSLTGVRNRRGLEHALEEAFRKSSDGIACAVAQLSLDRFKLVNDLYGHASGDLVLRETAVRLLQAIRSEDHIGRISDSFIVIFIDCSEVAMTSLSDRIREAVQQAPYEIDGKRFDLSASVGVVTVDPAMSMTDVIAATGRACAEAKARGRNCVVKLDERDSKLRNHLDELKVVADLRHSVSEERFFLEFQPIISLHTPRDLLSYEILIRMRETDGRVVPPGRFIGAAERNGMMSVIDRWVLRNALEWLDSHPLHRDLIEFATLNISGASLNDARFIDDAFAMISDHPLAMQKLCFEITEGVALNDIAATRRFIERIRMYGSKLALDDFGAGYTSFNYLKEIPADLIKIDGTFVKDINLNPANYAITRTIVDLTHELGMRSIAEWAETPETVSSLIELGVDYGQGFGLARPMDKQRVTEAPSGGALVTDQRVLQILCLAERGMPVTPGLTNFRERLTS